MQRALDGRKGHVHHCYVKEEHESGRTDGHQRPPFAFESKHGRHTFLTYLVEPDWQLGPAVEDPFEMQTYPIPVTRKPVGLGKLAFARVGGSPTRVYRRVTIERNEGPSGWASCGGGASYLDVDVVGSRMRRAR